MGKGDLHTHRDLFNTSRPQYTCSHRDGRKCNRASWRGRRPRKREWGRESEEERFKSLVKLWDSSRSSYATVRLPHRRQQRTCTHTHTRTPCIAEHETQRTQTNRESIPPHITHPIPQQSGTVHGETHTQLHGQKLTVLLPPVGLIWHKQINMTHFFNLHISCPPKNITKMLLAYIFMVHRVKRYPCK